MAANLLYDVHESPKRIGEWITLSIQHVLAMFVACITVPLIVYSGYFDAEGLPLYASMIAPTLVSAGVGTIFYLVMTKMKSPVFLASSFAYIAPMSAALALGSDGRPNLWALPIGMAFVGVVYLIIALLIKLFGVKWLNRVLPPIVIGPVIMVIGLSLAGSAVNNLVSAPAGTYNLLSIGVGLIGALVAAICAHYGKKTIALIPFLIGMASAYVLAAIITGIGYYGAGSEYCKLIDFSPIVNNFKNLSFASFLDYPRFLFLQKSAAPLEGSMIGKIALLFIPVALVTVCEHIGDHENLSGILERNLLEDPGLSRTLIGDGVATAISGILCGAANTTYGENVAVVGVTKVASTKIVLTAAGISIALGFLKPIMCIAQTIPTSITGGVSLLLYGFIAASGVKLLIKEKVDMTQSRNIFIASGILIPGIGGLTLYFLNPDNPAITVTSIAVAMIIGIIVNMILKPKKEEPKQPIEKENENG